MINWLLTQKKVMNLLIFVAIIVILALIFFPQIVRIVERVKDSAIKIEMAKVPLIATEIMIFYGRLNESGRKIYCGEGGDNQIRAICDRIRVNSPHPVKVSSFYSAQRFCIQVLLHNRKFWRVDYTGSMSHDLCGYIGRWDINENSVAINGTQIRDRTGANHGILSTSVVDVANKSVGGVIKFDGVDDYVRILDSESLSFTNQNALTVEAWVTNDTVDNISRHIVAKNNEFMIGRTGAIEGHDFEFFIHNGVSWEPKVTSGVVPVSGAWYHVVGIWTGTELKIYVNGKLKETQARITTIQNTDNILEIGSKNLVGHWKGRIDNVRIYSRALTPEEVFASWRRNCPRFRPNLCP